MIFDIEAPKIVKNIHNVLRLLLWDNNDISALKEWERNKCFYLNEIKHIRVVGIQKADVVVAT